MMLRRSLCLLVLVSLIASATAVAQPTPGADGKQRARAGAAVRDPAAMLERVRVILSDLKLTDEQKPKIDEIFSRATEGLKAIQEETKDAQPQEKAQQLREFMTGLREEVVSVLDQDQAAAFEQKLAGLQQRPGAGQPAQPGQQQGQQQGRGQIVQRLREAMNQLELTDEQKPQVDELFTELEAKTREIRQAAQQGNPQEARQKARELTEEYRGKLMAILTPEQKTKLLELMQQAQAEPGQPGQDRPRRDRDNPPASKPAEQPKDAQPKDAPKMDEPAMGDKPTEPEKPKQDSSDADNDKRAAAPEPPGPPGPRLEVGQAAPDFKLTKLDGAAVQLSSFKGKLVVVFFGSYTSPSFRQRAVAMEEFRRKFASRAQFLLVYTKEAHPKGGWEVDRNEKDKIEIKQHKDLEQREAAAKETKLKLNLAIPIVLDSMDDASSRQYNAWPNNAVYLIGRDGEILHAQQWFEPFAMEEAMQAALKS